MASSFYFFCLLFLSNCSAYLLPLPAITSIRLSKLFQPKPKNNDSPTRGSTSATLFTPQDLEDAFAEVMWRMKILQEDPEFLSTQPQELQRLFQQQDSLTHVGPSSIPQAGQGLFATRDIPAGSIITFYPVHALGVQFADGSCFLQSRRDHDPASSVYVLSLTGNRPILGTMDLEQHFQGMAFVDADPTRETSVAWKCHCINDGAVIQHNTPEDVLRYYKESLQAQNAVFCPFGPAPIVAAVATQDIVQGQEIFTCYGRAYWLGVVERNRDLWSPRTDEIQATEQKIAQLIQEATEYAQGHYEREERQLSHAFYKDLA